METPAFRRILGHKWPFNLRELRQVIVAVSALAEDDGIINAATLSQVLRQDAGLPDDPAELQRIRDALVEHMTEHRGNTMVVARMMGKTVEEVQRILRSFHIDPAKFTGERRPGQSSQTPGRDESGRHHRRGLRRRLRPTLLRVLLEGPRPRWSVRSKVLSDLWQLLQLMSVARRLLLLDHLLHQGLGLSCGPPSCTRLRPS